MVEQYHIIDINITINSITTMHDGGVHPFSATSPWSNFQWLRVSIMLKNLNTSVYNAQKALKPIPMAPECQKMPM